jgi:aldose 1-epimerase
LRNAAGMEVKITNYGGTITQIHVKDRNGKFGDVVLGFKDLSGYTSSKNTSYFGALIGRYGNRIAGGTFKIGDTTYHIPINEKERNTALHGGLHGFNTKVWDVRSSGERNGQPTLVLHYLSPDGEEGFPGNLDVTVTYSITRDNGLKIEYRAKTDKPTVVNLTNHTYFNLQGPGHTAMDHMLMIAADRYTPVNANLIPTGVLAPVKGTPFDFTSLRRIGDRINDDNEQLKYAGGYDQNWVLNSGGNPAVPSARVEEPVTGRVMEVFTAEPGIQFYSGNFLDGSIEGIGGRYEKRSAICLETQHFPDSPNHPEFPSTLVKPGIDYHTITIYRFSTKK